MRKFEVVAPKHRKHAQDPVLPRRSSVGSAGYDLCSCENVTLYPGDRHMFWLDVKASMEENDVLMIHPRSGLGSKGFRLVNTTGVVDASYYGNESNDGNIGVYLVYDPPEGSPKFTINVGDRIAQAVFINYLLTDDDDTTEKRTGGFGSSGVSIIDELKKSILPCKRCGRKPVIRNETSTEETTEGNVTFSHSICYIMCEKCNRATKDFYRLCDAIKDWNGGNTLWKMDHNQRRKRKSTS